MSPSSTPDNLRERKKAQTRTALLRAGIELFAAHGYEEVTVQDICAAADVSPRTFFRYFATKADLVFHGMEESNQGMVAELRALPPSRRPWPALTHALLGIAEEFMTIREEYLALQSMIEAAPELRAGNAAVLTKWERNLSTEVARLLPAGAREHARLLTSVALAAFRAASDEWAQQGGEGGLVRRVAVNLDLVQATAQCVDGAC